MISSSKNGNFYYIKRLELVDECFIECLGYMLSIVGRYAEVSLELANGNKFIKKYGEAWIKDTPENEGQIKLGTIASGLSKNFVCKVHLPEYSNVAEVVIGNATLKFSGLDDKNHTIKTQLVLPVSSDESTGERNKEVEKHLTRVQAVETLRAAKEDYAQGRKSKAKQELAAFKIATRDNRNLEGSFQSNLSSLLDEEVLSRNKSFIEREEALSVEAFKPGLKNISKMNSYQVNMVAKKKGK